MHKQNCALRLDRIIPFYPHHFYRNKNGLNQVMLQMGREKCGTVTCIQAAYADTTRHVPRIRLVTAAFPTFQ